MANANKAEEQNPCEIIKIKAPFHPHTVFLKTPANIKDIWPTEEYAINALKSIWRKHITLVNIPPHKAKAIIKEEEKENVGVKYWYIRIIPYPPNFKRIAAKTMEPATGASTWALGNHKWTLNIGSLTKKANNTRKKINEDLHGIKFSSRRELISSIFEMLKFLVYHIIVNKSGKDAVTV